MELTLVRYTVLCGPPSAMVPTPRLVPFLALLTGTGWFGANGLPCPLPGRWMLQIATRLHVSTTKALGVMAKSR